MRQLILSALSALLLIGPALRAQEPRLRATLARPKGLELESVRFSPDGKVLVAAMSKQHPPRWCDIIMAFVGGSAGLMPITGAHETALKMWDVSTGRQLASTQYPHGGIQAVAFTRDGKRLATGHGRQVRLWEVVGGTLRKKELLGKNSDADAQVLALTFSPDGRILVAGGEWRSDYYTRFGEVRLYDVPSGEQRATFRKLPIPVERVEVSSDGRTMAATARKFMEDNRSDLPEMQVLLYDLVAGKQRAILPSPNFRLTKPIVYSTTTPYFTPDGKTLIVAHAVFCSGSKGWLSTRLEGAVQVYDVATGEKRLTLQDPKKTLLLSAVSPDGRLLAVMRMDKEMRIDKEDGADAKLILYDVATGEEKARQDLPFSPIYWRGDGIGTVSFTPNSKTLTYLTWPVHGDKGKKVELELRVWDLAAGKPRVAFKLGSTWLTPLLLSDTPIWQGGMFAGAREDGTVSIWDVAKGRQLTSFKAHAGRVTQLTFGPGGRTLVSWSTDGEAKLWDLLPVFGRDQ